MLVRHADHHGAHRGRGLGEHLGAVAMEAQAGKQGANLRWSPGTGEDRVEDAPYRRAAQASRSGQLLEDHREGDRIVGHSELSQFCMRVMPCSVSTDSG